MDWTDLNSSLIQSIQYDEDSGNLQIQFHQGRRYEYEGVSPHLAQHLAQAPSPGRFFLKHIKPNFSGSEITED